MNMKKLLALVLSLMLLMTCTAFAEVKWTEEEYTLHADIRTNLESDYSGKTVILHSNDIHGRIDGYAYIAGLRDYLESIGAEVVLVDCGDFSQGTVYVNLSKGKNAVKMMNAVKYDVATLGNHEFDFGFEQLKENLAEANFQTICCNVHLDETGESILPAAAFLNTRSGLKLGFVGVVTPETVTKVNPTYVSMLTFSTFDKLTADIQAAVDQVRDQSDLVIALMHLGVDEESANNGYRSADQMKKLSGIDIALDGHSHTRMTCGEDGELLQSTGCYFECIGMVVIDNETKKVEDHFILPTYRENGLYSFNYVNEDVKAASDSITAEVDKEYSTVFAHTQVRLIGEKTDVRTGETNLGDLITDAMAWYVLREGGIEQTEPANVVAITNGGSIRTSIEAGDITKKDINTVMPFGNTVAVVYLTGEELLEVLEASTFCTPEKVGGYPQTSGMEWTLDTTKAYDQGELYMLDGKESAYYAPASINRVSITSVNGQPFDPKATYAVVTNNFCAIGGDTYNVMHNTKEQFDTGILMEMAVNSYIEEVLGGEVTEEAYGKPAGRITQIR